MGKFIVYGVLIEEPKRGVTSNGIDTVTLLIEEKTRNSFNKDIINVYSVEFMGKAVNCIPENMRLIGAPVVVSGSIRSREYKERYYNDLIGDGITIINAHTFVSKPAPEQASEPKLDPLPADMNVDDDDLPF